MRENEGNRLDLLVDLLADEVAERLRAAGAISESGAVPGTRGPAAGEPHGAEEPTAPVESPDGPEGEGGLLPPRPAAGPAGDVQGETGPAVGPVGDGEAEETGDVPQAGSDAPVLPPGPAHTARLLGRLALGMLVLLVIINIPINRHGTTLATAMPDARALVFRDGLVVKEEGDPEIYVFQDGQFRWISSLDAFEELGYTWADVHVVEDGFLDDYVIGAPIHVLLMCDSSPHIYRVEAEEKRWIVDIDAFEAEGHVWEDVRFVTCQYLRNLPDGETIPPGHGPPPQP